MAFSMTIRGNSPLDRNDKVKAAWISLVQTLRGMEGEYGPASLVGSGSSSDSTGTIALTLSMADPPPPPPGPPPPP